MRVVTPPFDEPRLPLVIEIYPRTLTGAIVKSSAAERLAYLRDRYRGLAARIAHDAARCDDAFDALVSALVMAAHVGQLAQLQRSNDPCVLREGAIWTPPVGGVAPPAR